MVGFLDLLQQLGGQPFQQVTVTLKFKMASKMAAIFIILIIRNPTIYNLLQ